MGRHNGVRVTARQSNQGPLERHDPGVQRAKRPSEPEAQVRRHLIVARPAGVELSRGRPDARFERRLDVHVDVFEVWIPRQASGNDLGAQSLEPTLDRLYFGVGEDARPPEYSSVGSGRRQIVEREGLVDLDRPSEIGGG